MIRQNENGRKTPLDGDKTTIVRDRGIASEKEPEEELVAEIQCVEVDVWT